MLEGYISREAAVKAANEWVSEACMAPVMRVSRLFDKLAKVPAADVAEVVHGRWILHHTVTGNPYTECSNCCTNVAVKTDKGTFAKLDMRGIPYCPFCSAKMDGGDNDAAD